MLLVCHSKILHKVVFSFSWELKWPQEKLKTILTQKFGVTNKEHYGMLWYFLEWSIQTWSWGEGQFPPAFFLPGFNFFGFILEFSKFVVAMQRSYTIALSLSFSEFLRSEAAFPSKYKVEHLSVTELLTQTGTICFVNKLLLFPNYARFVYYTVWHWN